MQRVLNGEGIVAVAQELDIHRRLLFGWLQKARPAAGSQERAAEDRRRALGRQRQPSPATRGCSDEAPAAKVYCTELVKRENQQLKLALAETKQALADKTLEVDFFRGALQKIEARRQARGKIGETASTARSRP
jgi:hypothetical protein